MQKILKKQVSINPISKKVKKTHLLSDDEVDELAVLLGINLYSAEDHRIFITGASRIIIEQVICQTI